MRQESIIHVERELIEQSISVTCESTEQAVSVERELVAIVGGQPYTGDYTITPTQETQVLMTSNLRMTDNVTINPIPSNYGLITWDGSKLTVS
jgi:hypothetical protein